MNTIQYSWLPGTALAAIIFSDGRYAGGMLDRNGLRPARVLITKSGEMVVASETGVLDVDPADIEHRSRLKPGKILMVDTEEGKIIVDRDIKRQLATEHPYSEWIDQNRIVLSNIKSGRKVTHDVEDMERLLTAFGYNSEDIDKIIKPMASSSAEPLASMGNDAPLSRARKEAATVLQLFPPAVCPGDQPSYRPNPRRARHVADKLCRSGQEKISSSPRRSFVTSS